MSELGDVALSQILYTKFLTADSSGVPTALVGGAISIYKDDGTTQSTSGITLTASFDSVVGLNNIKIDTSSDGAFYAAGHDFQIVITTGTVGGVSVVGYVVGEFSINNRTALRPTTAGRTLTIAASGAADADVKYWNAVAVSTLINTIVAQGTASAGGATSITLAGASATDSLYVGAEVLITGGTGAGQTRTISAYVGATKVATVARAWATNPDNTSTFAVMAADEATVTGIWAQAMSDLAAGAPSATASVLTALNYLYEAWRNGGTQTSTTTTIFKDDGVTPLTTSSKSDAAGTFTKGEYS